MSSKFLILFLLISFESFGQISYTDLPLDYQLIGRDRSTNRGTFMVKGVSEDLEIDSIRFRLYRIDSLVKSVAYALDYTSNGYAQFEVTMSILAELANYTLIVSVRENSLWNQDRQVDNIVAGDAYIIHGQSNAVAKKYNGSADHNRSNFIRVFALGTSMSSLLLSCNKWFVGYGNRDPNGHGNTGQWGLKFARLLVDSVKIPIAIFNGAHGGKEIEFFQRPENFNGDLTSNYGRLLYRTEQSGLKDAIRAIFWSQGGTDSQIGTSVSDYINSFSGLKKAWREDFPSLEEIYIFQSRWSCRSDLSDAMNIKEAQRLAASDDSLIHIMPTSSFTIHTDDCHFPFKNGYESFALRLFQIGFPRLYNTGLESFKIPKHQKIVLEDQILKVYTNDSTLQINDLDYSEFSVNTYSSAQISVDELDVEQNVLILTLSETPPREATLTYVGDYLDQGNLITNHDSIELLAFHEAKYDFLTRSEIVLCQGQSFSFGNQILEDSGVYTEAFTLQDSRDSIVVLSLTFTECNSLSDLNEPIENANIISPNPAQKYLRVDFAREFVGAVELISIDGKKHVEMNVDHSRAVELDLIGLPLGLYILLLSERDGAIEKLKFIKE